MRLYGELPEKKLSFEEAFPGVESKKREARSAAADAFRPPGTRAELGDTRQCPRMNRGCANRERGRLDRRQRSRDLKRGR